MFRKNYGHYYFPGFVTQKEKKLCLEWFRSIHPIWEKRYSSPKHPRWLLRPVYWIGNWQFACLHYYRPPKGIRYRCIEAENFSPVLATMIARIEALMRQRFRNSDIPSGWHLNTCLVNFYGSRFDDRRRFDSARVGEHKDFEPGPVASVSFGERALFQFVASTNRAERRVVMQQWLDDGSLQFFGGDRFKRQLFHRIQRVDRKTRRLFNLEVKNFETRRINLTFRFVPPEHITPLFQIPKPVIASIHPYVTELALHSTFWKEALNKVKM